MKQRLLFQQMVLEQLDIRMLKNESSMYIPPLSSLTQNES